jgi:hypothetical protein
VADVDRRSRPACEIAADYWCLDTDLGGIEPLSKQQLEPVERAALLLPRIRAHSPPPLPAASLRRTQACIPIT